MSKLTDNSSMIRPLKFVLQRYKIFTVLERRQFVTRQVERTSALTIITRRCIAFCTVDMSPLSGDMSPCPIGIDAPGHTYRGLISL